MKNKFINLDITTRCPNKCLGCIRQHPNFKPSGHDMTISEIRKIVDFFDGISFCGQNSDPLTHPNFLDLLKVCTDKNKQIEIHTAISSRSDEWWDKAISITEGKNVEWIFGIDGLPEDSNKYRVNQDGKKLFDQMIKVSKYNVKTSWQYIVFNYNENNIDQCRSIAEQNNITFYLLRSHRWDLPGLEKLKPSEQWISGRLGHDLIGD